MSASSSEDTPCKRKIAPGLPEIITKKEAKNLSIIAFGPEAEIVEYAIHPYSDEKIGFLASHQRLVIRAKHNGDANQVSSLKTSYFIKTLPYDVPTQADYIREKGVFQQETHFFRDVVPELAHGFACEPWAPECHIIKNDCLVFEDLGDGGFSMSDKLFDDEEIKAGLGTIARLHAASLHAEARLRRPLGEMYPSAFEERAFVDRGNQYRWYQAGVDVAVKIAENLGLDATRIPEACRRVFEAMKPSRSKQNVASHGDLWSNNLMFDESRPPRCRIVDFQLARYAPLGHDVAQFLHLCASKDLRDSRDEEMIRFYYKSLEECVEKSARVSVKIPPFRDVKAAYEEQKLAAVVTAVMYFPTVLLDGHLGATIMNDSESYDKFVFCDRRDVVVENMKRDEMYRRRIEETVRELVEYSLRIEELPEPC